MTWTTTGGSELLGSRRVPVSFRKESFGVLPLIVGSLVVTVLSMAISVPVGISAAVYIAEIAARRERAVLKGLIEVLATVPSVVLGFFGLVVLGPLMKDLFGLSTGMTALTASLLLAVMAIPTVVAISENAIRGVPQSLKTASLAVGASPLQTMWRVADLATNIAEDVVHLIDGQIIRHQTEVGEVSEHI